MGKVLGLDIGIASVGWSLIDTDRNKIIRMGARIFESADASNNEARREARSARRNLRRKKYRLKSIEELLTERGFQNPENINLNPYELRVRALTEEISKEELYIALYHLGKRRGISYLDEAEEDSKDMGESLNENRKLLKTKHPCQIQLDRLIKYGKTRGIIETKDKTLINVFTTGTYKKEAISILNNQSKFHKEINDNFIEEYVNILTRKRDFYVGPGDELNRTNYGIYKTDGRTIDSIFEELIGKCSIYTDERRAPVGSFTAQEFNLLNDLNNLVIEGRKLTKIEKEEIIEEVLNSKVKSFTFKRMINIIKKVTKTEDENNIKGYRIDKKENPEFHTFEAERKIKMFLDDTNIDYKSFDIDKKDKLAEVLSMSMDYKSLKKYCQNEFKEFTDEDIDLLFEFLQSNKGLYARWHSFSLKVMKEMRDDLYIEPVNQMNILTDKGIKKTVQKNFDGYKYIPLGFLNEEIYNPVVRRSINQSIGIVNAIIKKYGELEAIIIEMPRETNADDEKKKIQEMQKNFEKEKNEALNRIRSEYGVSKKQLYSQRGMIEKIRLWYQQEGQCIYTGEVISIRDLINKPDMFETDHIIPKSISLDDSLNNKVLVYSYANQIKGQRTPFNAFSTSVEINYNHIKERSSKLFDMKKISKSKFDLLTFEEDINKHEIRKRFLNRNLVDTRYASKAILNGLQEFMNLKEKNTVIHVVRGKFTYQIRKRWGIEKDRDESYAHHGVDAAIVAASYMLGQSDGTIRNPFLQKLGKYNKNNYWGIKSNKDYDKEVYKLPWEEFIRDLRIAEDNIKYSHKIDTKINRQISDLNPISTREVDGEDYIVKKYRNIYDNDSAKKLINKVKKEMEKFEDIEDSKILMRKHDPQTFGVLVKIINEYEGEKPNPFEAYRREHGYIRKYSKKGNGSPIKDIKYLDSKLGEGIIVRKTEKLSPNKRVALLSLTHYRTDVYFNKETKTYKNISINYNDIEYTKGKYMIKQDLYNCRKEKLGINNDYEFLFSLHKNDVVGIISKKEHNIDNRFRFITSRTDNPNKITVRPINREEFNKNYPMIIGTRIYKNKEITISGDIAKFNKYQTDILGNVFNVQGERLKLEFELDNINNS